VSQAEGTPRKAIGRPSWCLGAFVLIFLCAAQPVGAAFPGQPGRIVFSAHYKDISGPALLWDFDPRGGAHRRLTRRLCANGSWRDESPDYSPDGRFIAYIHRADGCPGGETRPGIWMMEADGSNPRQLAPLHITGDAYVAFSPDGRQIALAREVDVGHGFEYEQTLFAAADGTPVQRAFVRTGGGVFGLDWSATGRIAAGLYGRVFTLRPDGTDRRGRTRPLNSRDSEPDWSPSGKTLVYVRSGIRGYIGDSRASQPPEESVDYSVVMRVSDRRRPTRRLRRNRWLYSPVVSPSGRQIAFHDKDAIYLMGVNGGRPRRVLRAAPDSIETLDWQALAPR
jgi:Tol biopolymer transport system component